MSEKNISEKHRSLLNNFAKALSSRDREGMRNCLKDDVVWHIPPFGKALGVADPVGVENVIELIFNAPTSYYKPETMKFDGQFMITDETHGAFQFTMSCQTVNGGDYSNIYVLTFRFEDGLIAEAWEHLDSIHFSTQVSGKLSL